MPSDQTNPPQQLSADRSHPWYDAYWVRRARVLVNGIERGYVVLADGPGRRVEVIRQPSKAGSDGKLLTDMFEGDVVIVTREASEEPVWVVETDDPSHLADLMAWFEQAAGLARLGGAGFVRASTHGDPPTKAILEAWRERPIDQGRVRWGAQPVSDVNGRDTQ